MVIVMYSIVILVAFTAVAVAAVRDTYLAKGREE